jgi:hypothetical protein
LKIPQAKNHALHYKCCCAADSQVFQDYFMYRIYCTNLDYCSKGRQKNNSSRGEIYVKNSRIHLDRLQNKYTNYKGIKNNPNSGQITGIQEKLDKRYK